jgi:hypothetical protein
MHMLQSRQQGLRQVGRLASLLALLLTLTACEISTLGGSFTVLNLLLQRQDLPGWSYEVSQDAGTTCGSRQVRSQPNPPVTTVLHQVIECVNDKVAKERFQIELKMFEVQSSYDDIGAGRKPAHADDFKAWCETTPFGLTDGRDKSIKKNASCVVVVRYGRVVSRMSTFGNSATNFWPTGDDLINFTTARDEAFAELGMRK